MEAIKEFPLGVKHSMDFCVLQNNSQENKQSSVTKICTGWGREKEEI